MLGKKDCRQTDGLSFSACLSDCLCVLTNFTKNPSLPNPTTLTDFSLIPSHCTAFTHDVNTNAPKKPQPPPPPTLFKQSLPSAITSSIISHSSYRTKKRNKTKGKASVSSPCSLETPG
ncbi:hypothetical protein E3U43_006050 [Larimichthys crocea]|uniref:Uncharacterized protein n=1 Tax=Larimichthys crocea TaxID=215358 RepID=A0ACD3QNC1_LARCR|nr:hypothetical protein E3U43_006050 [Larimichthys crocea]